MLLDVWYWRRWLTVGCGSRGLPVVGKQFIEAGDGVRRDAQNVALALMVAFFVIMLLELGERFPQRSFPDQDQVG